MGEQFVDFCEDAIFEMQISASLSADDGEAVKVKAAPSIPGEDEPRGLIAPMKEQLALGLELGVEGVKMLHPANISAGIAKFGAMTPVEKGLAILTLGFWIVYGLGLATLWIGTRIGGTVLYLMRGLGKIDEPKKKDEQEEESKKAEKTEEPDIDPLAVVAAQDPSGAFAESLGVSENLEEIAKNKKEKEELDAQVQQAMKDADEAKKKKAASTSGAAPSFDVGKYMGKVTSFLARNFFTIKFFALVIVFMINFMLLFFKVSQVESEEEAVEDDGMGDALDAAAAEDGGDEGGDDGGEEEDPEEYIHVEHDFWYLDKCINCLGLIHCFFSFCMLVAYYNLKIPLAIFKREKEVSRKMEFDGIYIAEQPEDDNLKGHWDKLVISAKSFPVNYWDKFVKKRVREKYQENYEFDALSEILGMEKSAIPAEKEEGGGMLAAIKAVDWRYQVWQVGVTVTDSTFLYLIFYFVFSILGNYNYFFFAAHLIDVAIGVPALRIILQAITYNGKELVLTVGLLSIVCYIYTVLAF